MEPRVACSPVTPSTPGTTPTSAGSPTTRTSTGTHAHGRARPTSSEHVPSPRDGRPELRARVVRRIANASLPSFPPLHATLLCSDLFLSSLAFSLFVAVSPFATLFLFASLLAFFFLPRAVNFCTCVLPFPRQLYWGVELCAFDVYAVMTVWFRSCLLICFCRPCSEWRTAQCFTFHISVPHSFLNKFIFLATCSPCP